MEFRVLGPLEIRSGTGEILVPTRRKERELLAILLLHANRPVSVDTLVAALWDERPPASAVANLQSYLSDLRRVLPDAAAAGAARLQTGPGGYLLLVDGEELDSVRFERLAAEGRNATGGNATGVERHAVAAERLARALGLWRGRVLEGLALPDSVQPELTRLEELRLAVLEDSIDARLATGQHAALSTELPALVAQHDLRERLWGQLMLALYRSGRQADALSVYQRLHRLLDDELGVRPGPPLQQLHHQILSSDPSLDVPAPIAAGTMVHRPRQLPADTGHFTGRAEELKDLDALLLADNGTRLAAPAVCAIVGTAGVGKTALAVHWAHRARDRFPDGQLHVNLRGYDPDQPMTAADALARFLTALGVAGRDIPPIPDERAARFRTETADRRMLIVLDNASTVEQVRPLLPGTGSCGVVVTSRDSLAGLVAVHGAHRLDLDLLPAIEAITLLHRLIGPRVEAEPDAATALAEQCVRLPLALRVAAELAISRPSTPLAELVVELANQQRRLDLLDAGGDPRAAVAAVFSWSIQQLPVEAARTFRLLGLHPGSDLDAYAAAALADTSLDQARYTLDLLARAHLVHPTGPGRYGMHDLLRAYATSLASSVSTGLAGSVSTGLAGSVSTGLAGSVSTGLAGSVSTGLAGSVSTGLAGSVSTGLAGSVSTGLAGSPSTSLASSVSAGLSAGLPTVEDAADNPRAALGRLFDYYLATAAAAADRLYPGEQRRGPRIRPAGTPAPALADPDTARGWLDAERCGLVAIAAHAAARGWPTHAVRFSTTLFRYLIGGHYTDALAVHTHARDAARQARDRAGEAQAMLGLGAAHMRLGRFGPANENLRHSLALFRQAGDQVGQARALNNLGVIEQRLSRYEAAADHYRQALALYRKAGDQAGEGWALNTLGTVEERLGCYGPAADHHRQALALSQQHGDRSAQANALNTLGVVEERLGRYAAAADHHRQALALYRQAGDQSGEAWALNNLGTVHIRLGRPGQAAEHHRRALTRFREIGDRDGEAWALNGLGEAVHTAGHPTHALTHHTAAYTVATDVGARDQQARAHTGLGHAHHTLGELTRAREHYEHALALYTDLGMPDADRVRAHLATLNDANLGAGLDGAGLDGAGLDGAALDGANLDGAG